MGKDDNIKWIDVGTKLTKELLKRKQKEYGDFDSNAYIIAKFIKSVLEVVNKKKTKSTYNNRTATYDCVKINKNC